jgi:hypothetical protein
MATRGDWATGARCSLEPGNAHLALAGCDDCDIRVLLSSTLGRVEESYRSGYIRQAQYEAFMHVWSTSAPRFSSLADGWREPPTDPEVNELVKRMREEIERRGQSGSDPVL